MPFDLLTVDFKAKNADKQLIDSLRDTGFAVIKNHPVPDTLISDVYESWKEFFKRSDKMHYLYDKKTYTGYFPFRSENAKYTSIKNLMEYFHYRQGCCVPDEIRNKTNDFFQTMNIVGSILLKWIENNLSEKIKNNLQIPLSEMIVNSNRTIIRILHYPPLTGDEELGAMRAAPHEDINLLTLLPAATTKGLQIQDNLKQWYDVSCDHSNIIVNSGEMLTALTQGYLPATTHQVVNPEGELAKKSRLSIPFFLHPNDEVVFYDGVTAYDFLMERLKRTVS